MTREVLVTIKGVRMTDGEPEQVDIRVPGSYYQRNGKHYILYDEPWEDGSFAKTTVRLGLHTMEIIRKGSMSTHMVFEQGKAHDLGYKTPAGNLVMELATKKFCLLEREELLEAEVDYSLKIHGEPVSDCRMKVRVENR